jgi:hypothetical protein
MRNFPRVKIAHAHKLFGTQRENIFHTFFNNSSRELITFVIIQVFFKFTKIKS